MYLLQIGKEDFKLLVKYLVGLIGFQRKKLIDDAQKIVEKYANNETARRQYKRAKKIIIGLSTEL